MTEPDGRVALLEPGGPPQTVLLGADGRPIVSRKTGAELLALTTASGLPYPEPGDPVANGAAAIQALAVMLDRYPRGLLARTIGTNADAVVAGIQYMVTSVTLPSARWVRVSAHLNGSALAATAASNATIYGGGVVGTRFVAGALAAGETVLESSESYFNAPAGPFQAYVAISVTTSAIRLVGASCFLSISDAGKQF